ncbi:MAG: GIY-YIG nuclease family protein [Patescibacteria group bacterium]|nr:GIY-YIG nuclease family protein [Patescibacteria group bacterium]
MISKNILYILQSLSHKDKFYVGITNRERERLDEHNRGQTFSTKKYLPWKVIYMEEFETKSQAMKRETYLKSINGYKEKLIIIDKHRKK